MTLRFFRFLLVLAALASTCAAAQLLYTATSRDYLASGDAIGRLFAIDPNTAEATLIGPIRVGGVTPVGITGLAVHPRTGLLYGITAGIRPEVRPSLVVINPKSGDARMVGPLGTPGTDLTFDSGGVLFVWLSELNQLGTVDLKTGKATGGTPTPIAATNGGGLAMGSGGTVYIAATTATGTIDTIDMKSGEYTLGPVLRGAPYLSSIKSLTTSSEGLIYAVNSNLGTPAKAALVIINPETGLISNIGPLPDDADGLAFISEAGSAGMSGPGTAYIVAGLVVLAVLAAVAVMTYLRKRR